MRLIVFILMEGVDISGLVKEIVSGMPKPFPYCVYVYGGGGNHNDFVDLIRRETSSLVVDVRPRCDCYEVDLG